MKLTKKHPASKAHADKLVEQAKQSPSIGDILTQEYQIFVAQQAMQPQGVSSHYAYYQPVEYKLEAQTPDDYSIYYKAAADYWSHNWSGPTVLEQYMENSAPKDGQRCILSMSPGQVMTHIIRRDDGSVWRFHQNEWVQIIAPLPKPLAEPEPERPQVNRRKFNFDA